MSGRTLKDAMELVCSAAGKEGFRHYDGSGAVWAGHRDSLAEATFLDWGLAESTVVILNAVAAGYAIVPKEPTQEMLVAADEAYEDSTSNPNADAVSIEMYRAMIKAAPK